LNPGLSTQLQLHSTWTKRCALPIDPVHSALAAQRSNNHFFSPSPRSGWGESEANSSPKFALPRTEPTIIACSTGHRNYITRCPKQTPPPLVPADDRRIGCSTAWKVLTTSLILKQLSERLEATARSTPLQLWSDKAGRGKSNCILHMHRAKRTVNLEHGLSIMDMGLHTFSGRRCVAA